jgi:hypothetical protein
MQDVCGVTIAPPPDPAKGWKFLAKLGEVSRGEGGPAEAKATAAAALGDPEVTAALGACWRADRARLDGLVLTLGGVRGLGPVTGAITRAARDAAERQEAAERQARVEAVKGVSSPRPLASFGPELAGYEFPAGIVIPSGYDVDADGVRKRVVNDETGEETIIPVASRPYLVVGRCRNVIDHTVTSLLAWRNVNGGWGQHTVPRATVSDARALVALSNLDAPFHSNNAAENVSYIAAFEAANAKALPEAVVSPVMGWCGSEDALSFLWGRHQVRADGVFSSGALEETPPARWTTGQVHLLPSDPGLRSAAEGFHAQGTFEGWVEAMRLAVPYPRLMLGVFAALVPPLMRLLPSLSNFVVDFCGVTSQGKTTTLRAAASVWGSPDERGSGILYSWDVTHVFAERIAALCDYLPVLLDDTKRARRREDVGRHVYNHASGIGRGRGSLTSVQRTTRTHSVLLSTGEEAITSFTNDGGTRARCICLWGSPLGGTDEVTVEVVRRLTAGIMANYGHLGPFLVRQLAGEAEHRQAVRQAYAEEVERWTRLSNGNGVASRAAHYVAALAVAEHLFYAITKLPRPEVTAVNEAWAAVVKGSAEADRATDALRQVLSWATAQQARFHGRLEAEGAEPTAPAAGWLGAWTRGDGWRYLAVLPTELRGFLERQKFDADAVLRTWDDRGWLLRDGRHLTRKVTIGERKERCYALSRDACDAADGGDDA